MEVVAADQDHRQHFHEICLVLLPPPRHRDPPPHPHRHCVAQDRDPPANPAPISFFTAVKCEFTQDLQFCLLYYCLAHKIITTFNVPISIIKSYTISISVFSSTFVQHWVSVKCARIAQWMAKAYGYAAKKKEAYKSKEVSLFTQITLLLIFDLSHICAHSQTERSGCFINFCFTP